ncbi:MAG: 2-dehydropantoate 2-reductase [Pyrinomonadaceae bacterium]
MKTVVVGAGAVGCFFGGMLARAERDVIFLTHSREQADLLNREGLNIDSLNFSDKLPVRATAEPDVLTDADFVLFCVKSPDTARTARALSPHFNPESLIISLQNGVDNADKISANSNVEAAAAVVYVGAEMLAPNHVKHNGRGDLVIGRLNGSEKTKTGLEKLSRLFQKAGVPCVVSENVRAELWTKLIINCAYNAVSALSQSAYGRMVEDEETRRLMNRIIDESLEVASADGVELDENDLREKTFRIGSAMPGAFSSMAQDIERGRVTEIDALNGFVAKRGKESGIPTPVNQTLVSLIKLLERSA